MRFVSIGRLEGYAIQYELMPGIIEIQDINGIPAVGISFNYGICVYEGGRTRYDFRFCILIAAA
jgi:hypothetical protein